VAKTAGKTVQALLAKAPAPPRAQVLPPVPLVDPDPVVEPAPEEITPDPGSNVAAEPIATPGPAGTAAQSPRRRPASTSPTSVDPSAPPTLRLSQSTAQALRAAWLAAKRDRVLLTYQDFAGEVIAVGLRARQHSNP
jgi:hypothetical protein